MLEVLIKYSKSIREEMKALLREVRKVHGKPTVKGRKLGFRLMIWNTSTK